MSEEPGGEEKLEFVALGESLLSGIGRDDWHDRIAVCRRFKKEIVALLLGLHRAGVIGQLEIHPAPPEICDICEKGLHNRLGFVEGFRSNSGWSRMCLDCFFTNDEAVHCDEGRLYARYGDLWQCIGGGDPGLPRWRLIGGSEQGNQIWYGSARHTVDRYGSSNISELNLSVRTSKCLAGAGIVTVRDLIRMREEELKCIPLFGQKSVNEVKELLATMGLWLEMKV